jgi:DNA polymerase (family 10)
MINGDIAKIFDGIADLLEVKGDNPFRIRAYRRAAQNVLTIPDDLSTFSLDDLMKIPGIGKDLALKITEYAGTGSIAAWDELKADIPEGILDLLAIPGLGPKTVKLIYETLQITSLKALEHAARTGALEQLPHIKEKTIQNILKGIAMLKRGKERMPIGTVLPKAQEIMHYLKDHAPVRDISLAGSLRRWKETIKDIDILVTSDSPKKVMDAFVRMPAVADTVSKGLTKSSVVLSDGISVDVRVVEKNSYGAALQYFTGSKEHNIKMRERAAKKGLKINEYGIFQEKSEKKLGGKKEEDIYTVLGMDYVEPEMREDRGEIEAALSRELPALITVKDVRGDLHVHSDWSDGSHSIEEIAREAQKRGYEYIALTDHSKGLGIAHGLTEERIQKQMREIDRVNSRMKGFTILKGTEVDIKSDGSLDFPDSILRHLDIVVASVHSGFKQSREKITYRLVSAMKNPFVTVIAHPTGRLIGERDAYDVDMEQVLSVAAETGTAIEINAYPLRLDLNDIYARKAKEMGIPMVISTDTHIATQYAYVTYGVAVARRAWLEKKDVINTREIRALKKYMAIKKNRLQ